MERENGTTWGVYLHYGERERNYVTWGVYLHYGERERNYVGGVYLHYGERERNYVGGIPPLWRERTELRGGYTSTMEKENGTTWGVYLHYGERENGTTWGVYLHYGKREQNYMRGGGGGIPPLLRTESRIIQRWIVSTAYTYPYPRFLGDGVHWTSPFVYTTSSASLSSASVVESWTSSVGNGLSSSVRTLGGVVRPTYVSCIPARPSSSCKFGMCLLFSISETVKECSNIAQCLLSLSTACYTSRTIGLHLWKGKGMF